jgi:hypothetical protein
VLPLLLAGASLHAQYTQPQYAQPQYAQPQYAQQGPYANPYPPSPQYAQQQPYAQQPYPAQQYGVPVQQYGAQPYDQAPPQPADSQIYDQGPLQPGFAQPGTAPAQPLGADQLEQMLAPIALYPDALVAQILAAATYPAQVVGADHWLQAQGYASPDQVAYGADQQTWDPSVKALTAFPQVLAQMDRDIQWTTDLGNAYYNAPQDVLETIQVLRQRAESAGTLQSTPQEAVTNNQGYIQLAPVNPQVVYVPAYNPWDVYGQPIQPYPGFSLLGSLASFAGSGPMRFGLGIAMAAFSHTPFGWAGWALNWLAQAIFFHQSNYVSHSTTVAHWSNYPHGGLNAINRGYNGGPRPATAFARSQAYGNYNRPSSSQHAAQSFARAPVRNENDGRAYSAYRSGEAPNRGYQQPGNYARPAVQNNFAYNRAQPAMTAREQANGRSGGYQGGYGQGYVARPSTANASPQRNELTPRSYQAQRSNPSERSYSGYGGSAYGNRAFAEPRPEKSSGFFGGGHGSEKSYGSYKAPKSSFQGSKFKEPKFKAPKAPKEHSHGGGGGHHGGHRL